MGLLDPHGCVVWLCIQLKISQALYSWGYVTAGCCVCIWCNSLVWWHWTICSPLSSCYERPPIQGNRITLLWISLLDFFNPIPDVYRGRTVAITVHWHFCKTLKTVKYLLFKSMYDCPSNGLIYSMCTGIAIVRRNTLYTKIFHIADPCYWNSWR